MPSYWGSGVLLPYAIETYRHIPTDVVYDASLNSGVYNYNIDTFGELVPLNNWSLYGQELEITGNDISVHTSIPLQKQYSFLTITVKYPYTPRSGLRVRLTRDDTIVYSNSKNLDGTGGILVEVVLDLRDIETEGCLLELNQYVTSGTIRINQIYFT